MESFPSKAIRAFDKPTTFHYAPETGSFAILGSVASQTVCIVAGPAATAYDDSHSLTMSSDVMSVGEISDIVTNDMRLKAYIKKETTKPTPFAEFIPAWADLDEQKGLVIISDTLLGDFIIDAVPTAHPFTSKDRSRENLMQANLSLTAESADLVTTDGHRMQVAGIMYGGQDASGDFAIPSKLLSVLKLSSCLGFTIRETTCTLTCFSEEYDIITVSWKNTGVKYPDWRSVIPDVESEDSRSVEHCLPEFGKIPANARKGNGTVHFLESEDEPIPAFGIMHEGEVIYLSSDLAALDTLVEHFNCYTAVQVKYAWELGKLLKKIPREDISLCVAMEASTAPLRVDWEREGVQYTHVLMPYRKGAGNTWPGTDCG